MEYFTIEQKKIAIENIECFILKAEKIKHSAEWLSNICFNYANSRIFCADEVCRIKKLKREKMKLLKQIKRNLND